MKCLIIEDDKRTADFIVQGLNQEGYTNVSILYNRQEWEVLVDAGNGLVLTVDLDD